MKTAETVRSENVSDSSAPLAEIRKGRIWMAASS